MDMRPLQLPSAGSFVVPETPPSDTRQSARRGVWPERLEAARQRPGVWCRVLAPMTRLTASQIASDLRSSFRRSLSTIRVTGVVAGERWEARYGRLPGGEDPEQWFVWIRWVAES